MNLQAYAAHRKALGLRGQTHVAVLRAIESGRLGEPAARKEAGRWVIDPVLADAQWAHNTDANYEPPAPEPAPEPVPDPATPRRATRSRQSNSDGPSLADAKRAQAVYKAERERLALMREKGELILANDVKAEAARMARQVRDLLLMIPTRNAAKVVTMQDQEEVRALLQGEIESALRGLRNA